MRLSDVAGQDHAVALLLRAVDGGRVAQAYVFDGPPGVGKRSAALGLALALACPKEPRRGCGRCDVCHRILAGHHPDVRTVTAEKAQILIEQAQEVVLLAMRRPHEAPARVIVIDEADRLNAAAANCLLKTLEEPFPGTHVVLVTAAPDRLLPTIRSRTQRVRFVPVRPAVLVALASRRGVDTKRAETAAALAGGQVARLWELLGTDTDEDPWPVVAEWRRAAGGEAAAAIFDVAAKHAIKEVKESTLPAALALLGRFYRDALVSAAGAADLVLLRERGAELEALAAAEQNPRLPSLRHALAAVVEAETALASNVNRALVVERLLFELRPCERGVRVLHD